MRDPEVPESLDGWHILHRMFRFDRRRYDALGEPEQDEVAREFAAALAPLHEAEASDCALAQTLGHKSDLMLTHYGRSFDDLARVQTLVDKLAVADYLTPQSSYVSILELGLYDATAKIHAELRDRGLKVHAREWDDAFDALLAHQAQEPRNASRLTSKVPARRYVCFYPMDKKRGEAVNWYALPYAERARMMLEHGKIGRSFHGLVTQVISGSIGFDDWEWGVDLYADDPIVFKKLVYAMRFDETSAKYGAFGPFWTGMQFSIAELPHFLRGDRVPRLIAAPEREPALR
jgi:peroxiredoxin